MMSDKLWRGRFSEKTARIVETFTTSIHVDKRLYVYDIQGSIAHCKMLAKASIITEEEAMQLVQGLEIIKQEIADGKFLFDDSLEDIHMHIEARLGEIAGKVAQKLHTARSRNDQIVLDERMYLRDEISTIIHQLFDLLTKIVTLAKEHLNTILPGYTHLQRAQPILLAHHFMAYYEMFARDLARMEDCLKRTNEMPLGSAALAGTTYPIDREYTARLLGFNRISANSIDAVADRDFMMDFLSAASISMVHFSRFSEELILWSSSEFSFIELPDAFATGSSIMPQKKNPDVPELVRGKTGCVFGNLMAFLTMMKSLPLAYNRDMQEDKALLFSTVDTLSGCIAIYAEMLPKIRFDKATMQHAASHGFLNATDMADYLVTRGIPFREAHRLVGEAVSFALSKRKELHELTLEELQSLSAVIEDDIFSYLTTQHMIARRVSYGGTATEMVSKAIASAEEWLDHQKERLPKLKIIKKF
jgi:argininosuccinate lyase